MGQILSTRPDFVPPSVIVELAKLHDQVSASPFSDFEPVLIEELGLDWKLSFLDVDTVTPVGTASLAQVYRVRLADGTPAVVKIQRPGVRETVLQDMAILRKAARLVARAAPRFNAVIDIEAMLNIVFDAMEPEYNFLAEARNMNQARPVVGRFENLTVPEVLLATPRVLVQSLAPGVSIRTQTGTRSLLRNGRPSAAICWHSCTAATSSTTPSTPTRTPATSSYIPARRRP